MLVLAGIIGAVAKLGATGLKLWAEIVELGTLVGSKAVGATQIAAGTKAGAPIYMGINASPALLSVGYIVGFNVSVVIFAGAALNRWIAMPLFAAFGDGSTLIVDPDTHAAAIESARTMLDPTVFDANIAAVVGSLSEALKSRGEMMDLLGLLDPWGFVDRAHSMVVPRGDTLEIVPLGHQFVAASQPLPDTDAITQAGVYHGRVTRYLGVGGMLVGGRCSSCASRCSAASAPASTLTSVRELAAPRRSRAPSGPCR